jgi:hypothetical protein
LIIIAILVDFINYKKKKLIFVSIHYDKYEVLDNREVEFTQSLWDYMKNLFVFYNKNFNIPTNPYTTYNALTNESIFSGLSLKYIFHVTLPFALQFNLN